MNRFFFFMLIFSCYVSSIHAESSARDIKQMLLMPGELVQGHADIEPDCHKCHVHFDKKNQTPLCLDCHVAIAEDMSMGRGFHGHLDQAQNTVCVTCHTEHKGRQADIVGLDPDRFVHDRTEFPLKGAHEKQRCNACHKPGNGFRSTASSCVDCHEDIHDGNLGTTCTQCHSETNWSSTVFDHGETDFPLLGSHVEVNCSACHLDARFKISTSRCVDCHLGKDKHLGGFGTQCSNCHQPESWVDTRFDHTRDTRFALKSRHREIGCTSCHRKGLNLSLPQNCVSCHGDDDTHRGANGSECDGCHSEQSWKTAQFDHDTATDFLLIGTHRDAPCEGCHRVDSNRQSTVSGDRCLDCHGPIDPHQGQLGEACDQCHGNESWTGDTRFNHEFTVFPLTGSHESLPCEACHFSSSFGKTGTDCQNCHVGDDAHDGALGESCNYCHNTAAWSSWRYDHSEKSDYPLEGAHATLSCALCHQGDAPASLQPSTRCISCHAQDDVHRGGFGSDCGNCHETATFEGVR